MSLRTDGPAHSDEAAVARRSSNTNTAFAKRLLYGPVFVPCLGMSGYACAGDPGVGSGTHDTLNVTRGRQNSPTSAQGVRMATGSSSSNRSHTAGSSAFPEPWCGTLNTEAIPAPRASSSTIATQPCLSRSDPRRSEPPLLSSHSTTDVSFGERSRSRVLFPPLRVANSPTVRKNVWNTRSPGERDRTTQCERRSNTRPARAWTGCCPLSQRCEKTRYSSRNPEPEAEK